MNNSAGGNRSSALFYIVFGLALVLVLSVGGYFSYKMLFGNNCSSKSPDPTSNVSTWVYDSTAKKCVANVCIDGYGDAATGGSPDSNGNCMQYTQPCPNCVNGSCTGGKCSKCTTGYGTSLAGSPDSSGKCPPYYIAINNLDYLGDDIGAAVSSQTNDDCVQLCQADKNCKFAVRRDDQKLCYKKTDFSTSKKSGTTDAPNATYLGPVGLTNP
jgi:hypothetical protein